MKMKWSKLIQIRQIMSAYLANKMWQCLPTHKVFLFCSHKRKKKSKCLRQAMFCSPQIFNYFVWNIFCLEQISFLYLTFLYVINNASNMINYYTFHIIFSRPKSLFTHYCKHFKMKIGNSFLMLLQSFF